MNIVVITSGSRPKLINQTLVSLRDNASNWKSHHLTLVVDGFNHDHEFPTGIERTLVWNLGCQGASAARNIGAASIPKYRRQEHVCFFDDDIFAVYNWDRFIEHSLRMTPSLVISGHAHPFNHPIGAFQNFDLEETQVLSSVNMAMAWSTWDDVGQFVEPGGSGGSEDYQWCMRANKCYWLVVTKPQMILHTGITSSSGKPIVGQDQVIENNKRLEKIHGIEGMVRYE